MGLIDWFKRKIHLSPDPAQKGDHEGGQQQRQVLIIAAGDQPMRECHAWRESTAEYVLENRLYFVGSSAIDPEDNARDWLASGFLKRWMEAWTAGDGAELVRLVNLADNVLFSLYAGKEESPETKF